MISLKTLIRSSALGLLLATGAVAQDAPARPTGLGFEGTAPTAENVPAYIENGATNQRGDACMATVDTNAGVRLLSGFLKVWEPSTLLVDAGVEAEANGDCPAIVKSDWDGIPGSATDGKILDQAVHDHNMDYVVQVTASRSAQQAIGAYLDDRRGKNISMLDGLGPLADAWKNGAHQFTTITQVQPDATSVKYDDHGNNRGLGSVGNEEAEVDANEDLGLAVDFINAMSGAGSTEPAKRFYKYGRPWRWDSDVFVVPALEPAKSGSAGTDGGFPSGHTAEAWRDGLAMSYLVPERFQEILTRSVEMGDSRIIAGMHSPLDVIGGRMLGTATVVYNLNLADNAELKVSARAQALAWLQRQTGTETEAQLYTAAHAWPLTEDRFADAELNVAYVAPRQSYGFEAVASDAGAKDVVPTGAEVMLETRQPYLTAEQRRVVIKSTLLPAGFPVMDDAEGFGRLDYIRAADGYGAFDGDVTVTMDASLGGFNARDTWRNDIVGAGMLTKAGSGALTLAGDNGFTGGVVVEGGELVAASRSALGAGDVYVAGGTLAVGARGVDVGGDLTVLDDAGLAIRGLADEAVAVAVEGNVTLLGGTLDITLPESAEGVTLVSASGIEGTFNEVRLNGAAVEVTYSADAITLAAAQ
ncbi:hypothetical protein ASG47_14680 [Devosia sp. Leaf420]|uniref:acid phosphatase n=1 Tax=Devosia sp. Leaf420 TaxID=1736374 RepID=UPI0007153F13|nr:phosphatase PAP2 family protein [Devosia sp. Leaf420]KQT44692.1 hypothetical protein ASG47_14680 [Devosia sp. Leaf420]